MHREHAQHRSAGMRCSSRKDIHQSRECHPGVRAMAGPSRGRDEGWSPTRDLAAHPRARELNVAAAAVLRKASPGTAWMLPLEGDWATPKEGSGALGFTAEGKAGGQGTGGAGERAACSGGDNGEVSIPDPPCAGRRTMTQARQEGMGCDSLSNSPNSPEV